MLVYADSSALVKRVIAEPESDALRRYFSRRTDIVVATSRLASVEVRRAVQIANDSPEAAQEADRLLGGCMLIAVGEAVLASAAEVASATIRTLDAIHLASALRLEADEVLTYDRRLAGAARARGLAVVSPGATV